MIRNKCSFLLNTLSSIIGSQIFFYSKAIKKGRTKEQLNKDTFNTKNIEDISYSIIISTDAIILLKRGLDRIKMIIKFENIDNLKSLPHEEVIIVFKQAITTKKAHNSIHLLIFKKEKFLRKLSSAYMVRMFNKDPFINIDQDQSKEQTNKFYSDIKKFAPNGFFFKLNEKKHIIYLLHDTVKKNDSFDEDYVYEFPNTKNSLISRMSVNTTREVPIEKKKSDEFSFSYYANSNFAYFMKTSLGIKKFWIVKNTLFQRKHNFFKDTSEWTGWTIECRTKHNNNGIGLNFIFIYLRRQYIPPSGGKYCYITFILTEPYRNHDYEISYNARRIIEMAANYVQPEYIIDCSSDYKNLIELRMEGLLCDKSSFMHFMNNLRIYPKETIKFSLSYIYKIIFILEEYYKEQIFNIKKKFEDTIKGYYTIFDEINFNINHLQKNITNKDLNNLLRENDDYFISLFEYESYNESLIDIWNTKRNDFLADCLNGMIIGDIFNLKYIINQFKKNSKLTMKHGYILKNLVNIRALFNNNKSVDTSEFQLLVNNLYDVKELTYNKEMLYLLIENDFFKTIFEVSSQYAYNAFLIYLIVNHLSVELLNSIYIFLKSTLKENEIGQNENKYDELFPYFLNIFNNHNMNTLIIRISCQCLNILYNENPKRIYDIIKSESLLLVENYLTSYNEKLIFQIAEFLFNIIKRDKNITRIFKKNYPRIITNILKIIKCNNIPGCYYSDKTILLMMDIIIHLIVTRDEYIYELLDDKPKFIKYLINYLQNDSSVTPPEYEQDYKIQEKTYVFLNALHSIYQFKNFKWEKEYKFLKFLDNKCSHYFEIINNEIQRKEHIKDNLERNAVIISEIFKLIHIFINDYENANNIRYNCHNISKIVLLLHYNTIENELITESTQGLYNKIFIDKYHN